MANLCERLLAGCISASCDNPIYSGIDSTAYIFNRSEIDLVATEASGNKDASNANIYKSIIMKENDGVAYTGYKIVQTGKTPFTGTQTEMTEGNTANTFTNTFNFIVPDNSPAASLILDSLANGKFVVVIANEYAGSDERGKFQVYGMKKGLTASAMVSEKYSDDTEGAWAITLTEEKAPVSCAFLEHKTDSQVDTAEYIETIVDCE